MNSNIELLLGDGNLTLFDNLIKLLFDFESYTLTVSGYYSDLLFVNYFVTSVSEEFVGYVELIISVDFYYLFLILFLLKRD